MKNNRILVDGRLIDEQPNGISRYCLHLIKSYISEYGENAVYVLCNAHNAHLCHNPITTFHKPYNILHYLTFTFWLNNKGFSIYHSTSYSGLLFKLHKVKNIITVHDVFYRFVPKYFSKNAVVNYFAVKYYDFIVYFSLKAAKVAISVSETTKADVLSMFNKDSIVVSEGIDFKKSEVVRKAVRKDFYLYVGNLKTQKNVKFMIDVFRNLPHHELVMCGSKEGILDEWESIPNIRFIGFVPDELLSELYRTCKAVVFPSVYEGFGLPVLEALAFGTIVFSSTGGALKEFKNVNIRHFDPYKANELRDLILNADQFAFDSVQADLLLKKYDWEDILPKMHNKLKALL